MARVFTLQDIACLNLDGSSIGPPTPISASTSSSTTSSEKASKEEDEYRQRQQQQQQLRSSIAQHQMQQQQQPKQPQQQEQPQQAGDESDESSTKNAKGGGLFASGLSWFDKQREKRNQDKLKLEAVKQLKKIVEAERASRTSSNSSGFGKSAVDRSRSLCDFDDDHKAAKGSDGGVEGIISCSSNSNRTNPLSLSLSCRQAQYAKKQSGSFGTSDVSKSGEGVFGTLVMSDFDDLCGDDDVDDSVVESTTPAETNTQEDSIENTNEDDKDEEITPPVRVTEVEGDEASPYILSKDQMNEISKYVLPESITYCRWRRLYGLGRDGDSFDGCLRIIGTKKRTLMVVRTTKGDIFGGYADAPWHARHDSSTAKYFGSASSCLYSFSSTRTPVSTSSSPESSSINVYRWTGKNRYIQVCDVSNKLLAFGGGGDKGAFGVCLQEDFQRGTTGHCDTFDNDALCSNCERTFDVVDVEFWEFLTGVF